MDLGRNEKALLVMYVFSLLIFGVSINQGNLGEVMNISELLLFSFSFITTTGVFIILFAVIRGP